MKNYDYEDEEDESVPGLFGDRHSSVTNKDYPEDSSDKTDQQKDYENGWRKSPSNNW